MKYAHPITKQGLDADKDVLRPKPRFRAADPDQAMARRIQELAVKPLAAGRHTHYRELPIESPDDEPKNPIQWPSDQKIVEVSKKLAQIKKLGVRSEAHGDYFNSGDLAYQIQEIIRATLDLFQKSQRIKH